MSTSKRKLALNTLAVELGCGSCRKPKLSAVFHPKPKPKTTTYNRHNHYNYFSSSASSNTNPSPNTATTFSPHMETPLHGFGRVGGESVAVEKDSDDPYLDFRHSMLQMILENEIYSKDDLKELLNCFLRLNSPYHHGIIVRAFTEIWNGVFSVRSSSEKVKYHHNGWKSRDF